MLKLKCKMQTSCRIFHAHFLIMFLISIAAAAAILFLSALILNEVVALFGILNRIHYNKVKEKKENSKKRRIIK